MTESKSKNWSRSEWDIFIKQVGEAALEGQKMPEDVKVGSRKSLNMAYGRLLGITRRKPWKRGSDYLIITEVCFEAFYDWYRSTRPPGKITELRLKTFKNNYKQLTNSSLMYKVMTRQQAKPIARPEMLMMEKTRYRLRFRTEILK